MDNINVTTITDGKEIEFLRDKPSFNYTFDDSTMGLLKKNLTLKDSLYLLAKEEENFVAFCSVDRDWWEENFFFIREILVDPQFQKLGMGQKLIEQCIEHARNKRAIGVVTETAFDNFKMQKLCEKVGFKKWENPQWKEGITYKLVF